MKEFFKTLLSYFLRGVIVVVPFVAVFLAGKYLFDLIASYRILDSAWITLGIFLATIFIVGLGSRFLLFRPLFLVFESVLTHTPIFKFIYTSIKDLMKAFVGEQRRFTKPVLVDLHSDTELQRFGFVTTEDLNRIGPHFEGKVSVYIPMSYSVSGNLYIVPAERVEHLPHVDPAELMKFILAGGVTDLEEVLKRPKKIEETVEELPESDSSTN